LAGKIKNTNKNKEIALAGLKRKIILLDAPEIVFSFQNYLIASLKGCFTQASLTLLGSVRN
jgi:hypothetical protein